MLNRRIAFIVIAVGMAFIVLELMSQVATMDQSLNKIQKECDKKDGELKEMMKMMKQLNTSIDSCGEKLKITVQQLSAARNAEDNLKNKLKASTQKQETILKEQTELFKHILKPGSFANTYPL
jgi:septal ring factor EnvC (AmiA/AmiB activator)